MEVWLNEENSIPEGEKRESFQELMDKASKIPILDGKFFKIVSSDSNFNGKITANCQLCKQLNKTVNVRGTFRATSNFYTHLKRKHPTEIVSYDEYKKVKKLRVGDASNSDKKEIIEPNIEQLHSDIVDFIINSFAPLSTVENVYFRNIFRNLGVPFNLSRRTLCRRIKTSFNEHLRQVKNISRNSIHMHNSRCVVYQSTKIYRSYCTLDRQRKT